MNNVWLKIKIWTKGVCACLILLYLLIFVIENNQEVTFWWWRHHEIQSSSLLLLIIAFLAGVISTILVRTTLRTMRQIREVRGRSRTDRIERDLNDMKLKASRLQTKPAGGSGSLSGSDSTMSLPPDEGSV